MILQMANQRTSHCGSDHLMKSQWSQFYLHACPALPPPEFQNEFQIDVSRMAKNGKNWQRLGMGKWLLDSETLIWGCYH